MNVIGKLLEFNVVVQMKTAPDSILEELGIEQEENREERIVTYAFNPDTILEIRESFVMYKEEWTDATVCTLGVEGSPVYETPLLLISYEDFKQRVNEYYKEVVKSD